MGPQFFETRMGRKFYEHDVPELIQVLNRIADLLEKTLTTKEQDPSELILND